MLKAYKQSADALKKVAAETEEQAAAKQKCEDDFLAVLESSTSLDDLLDYLANHIWNGLNVSGVYIGQVEKVKKAVTEDDND